MEFGFPLGLWLLGFCPVLWFLALREDRQRAARLERLGEIHLLSSLAVGVDRKRRLRQRKIGILCFTILVLAFSGPRIGSHTELLPQRGLDVVFAIDVSNSMKARDISPDRLERAKAEIAWSLQRLKNNRVGIVVFAGNALVQCPLTTDIEAVRSFLKAIDVNTVSQGGTSLAAGLKTALNLFLAEEEYDASSKTAGRVMVVVSDGEDHEGGLEELTQSIRQAGISTVLIGIGSGLGEPIPVLDEEGSVTDYLKDRKGKTVMTRMSPDVLSEIASMLDGQFVDGTTSQDMGMSIVEQKVAQLEKRELEMRVRTQFVDRSVYFVLAAFLLMLIIGMHSERSKMRTAHPDGTARVLLDSPMTLSTIGTRNKGRQT